MTEAIRIQNVNKTYQAKTGDVIALTDISFSIEKGEIFGLLGPNGAGKSTLINILAGVTKKSGGKAFVLGTDIDMDHAKAKKILGIVPQEISFDSFMPVEQALKYEFGYYGQQVDQAYLDEVLRKLSLYDKRKVYPRGLSGGMKRRFMIARALMHRPQVLVLDEPTAGVDVELRHEMYDLIRQLNKEDVTIILTTHYLEEVELLCNRVAIIHKGKLIALDEKEELKNRFRSQRIFSIATTERVDIPEILKPFSPTWKDHELQLTFEEDQYADVLKAVADAHLPLSYFSVIEPTIEDVFVTLTDDKHHV